MSCHHRLVKGLRYGENSILELPAGSAELPMLPAAIMPSAGKIAL